MSHYRRANTQGGSYFFTVVSYRRQAVLCDEPIRYALRKAIQETRLKYPFSIDAWVLMPDHLHCIWRLPEGDRDYSKRWSLIKRSISIICADSYNKQKWLNGSKKKHRESTLWQRRFWEHQIRDQQDFNRHLDYIHYNPVKHGLCERADAWPYSTLH
ncbi:MAG: transposase [Gammaproteobacteria bacterium]|nr:MAG: transposase [Gammaproteobacteria bacterium]